VPLGLIVAIVLTAKHDIQQTQSEQIHSSLANRVRQQGGRAVIKTCQHLSPSVGNVSVAPYNFGELIAAQANFALLGTIQILHDRIGGGGKRKVITLTRRHEAAKTEERPNASPKHILRKDNSTLAHERGYLFSLRLSKCV